MSRDSWEIIANKDGYLANIQLTESELLTLRNIISDHWLYRIQLLRPDLVSVFDSLGIENYHKGSHLIEHETVWPTPTRVLQKNSVDIIKKMSFFEKLQTEFGMIEIADEEKFGFANMLWRIVRPNSQDCAPLHVDRWFWEIGDDWKVPNYPHRCINIWIAVYTNPEKNGLLVVPGSQKKLDWAWHTEIRYGKKKPIHDVDIATLDLQLLPLHSGDVVTFNHNLLHGGANNLSDTTRVSLEFTAFVPV